MKSGYQPISNSLNINDPPKGGSGVYWYRQYIGECSVCGRDAGWKERVYGTKPKDFTEIYIQLLPGECFDYCI